MKLLLPPKAPPYYRVGLLAELQGYGAGVSVMAPVYTYTRGLML